MSEAGHYEPLMLGWDLAEASSAARGAQLNELPAGQSVWQAFSDPVEQGGTSNSFG